MSGRSTIAVVVLCEGTQAATDGFVPRNEQLLRALNERRDTTVIALAPHSDAVPYEVDLVVEDPSVGRPRRGRVAMVGETIRFLLGRHALTETERALRAAVEATAPDAIVLLSYRRDSLCRAVRDLAPTVLFAEERPGRPRLTRSSWAPPVLGDVRDAARRRATRHLPLVAVVGPGEVAWATWRYESPVLVVPLGIDVDWWSAPVDAERVGERTSVLAIGNFTLPRNVEGLVSVIEARREQGWPPELELVLVSAAGFAPALRALAGEGVHLLDEVIDPRPLYRAATATVVPSRLSIGVKGSILQGWATGCPVLTTPESAATVEGHHGDDVLIGDDPEALARLLGSLDELDLERVATGGRRHLEESFSVAAHDRAVEKMLDSLLEKPAR